MSSFQLTSYQLQINTRRHREIGNQWTVEQTLKYSGHTMIPNETEIPGIAIPRNEIHVDTVLTANYFPESPVIRVGSHKSTRSSSSSSQPISPAAPSAKYIEYCRPSSTHHQLIEEEDNNHQEPITTKCYSRQCSRARTNARSNSNQSGLQTCATFLSPAAPTAENKDSPAKRTLHRPAGGTTK